MEVINLKDIPMKRILFKKVVRNRKIQRIMQKTNEYWKVIKVNKKYYIMSFQYNVYEVQQMERE